MATMLLQSVGTVIGGAIGGPVGSLVGRVGGSLLGSAVDRALFGASGGRNVEGPRLETMPVLSCEEGASIPRVYGRVRIGGQIIWATRFEESSSTTRAQSSGKGSSRSAKTTTTYQYFANFAVGLCEGPIMQVRRIWADGREIDRTQFNIRIYQGDENQNPDPLIVAKEGDGVPAFRGTAYVVFDHFPIADYSNRIPQFSFEVIRPLQGLGDRIQGVNIIPGSTEYGYATSRIFQYGSQGVTAYENRHQLVAETDWAASLDALQAMCPNLKSVVLVVAWFGDDLRVGQCSVAPRIESKSKLTDWRISVLNRERAREVSRVDGRPAYGGSPTDDSVLQAIEDLKARGLSVILSPFLMMDVPNEATRIDPWTGSQQERFPWRGRITCHPAPGVSGSVHGTAAARQQIATFFGSKYPPSSQWSYRRFILYYAKLCARSGLDGFLLGSELASLTCVSDGVREPAVDMLIDLAASVRAVLGSKTKIPYAANWTEYGSWTLDGKTVNFPLDALWADSNIDFIGIDFYPPLSDWRDGVDHADAALGNSIYNPDYMRSRLHAGEAFDWYYSDSAAREAQKRLPIRDSDYNEPWMFRPKDLLGWWSHQHFCRDNGVRRASPTAWIPQGKPIWLIECGCASIDRASNAPHIFFDAKKGAITAPYFSRSTRDDVIQEIAIDAVLDVYGTGSDTFNPVSSIYGKPMIDPSRIHIWSWDARPFPAFPSLTNQWADGGNWAKGHWLNGRLESLSLSRLLKALWSDFGAGEIAGPLGLAAKIDGFCIDRVMSLRDAVEPLSRFFRFDIVNDLQHARIVSRGDSAAMTLGRDDLVDADGHPLFEISIDQSIEVADRIELGFCDGDDQYSKNSLAISHAGRNNGRLQKLDLPIVLSPSVARKHGEDFLQDIWTGRETITLRLRPASLSLQIGDVICIPEISQRKYQIEKITDGDVRSVHARAIDPDIFTSANPDVESRAVHAPRMPMPPLVHFIELPGFGASSSTLLYVAVSSRQWMGPHAIWRKAGGSFRPELVAQTNATTGALMNVLNGCQPNLFNRGPAIIVQLDVGSLTSVTEDEVLAGANRAVIQHTQREWELIAFTQAKLIGPNLYELSGILRGIGGGDTMAALSVPYGSRFVLFDDSVLPAEADVSQIDVETTWRVGLATLDYSSPAFAQVTTRLRGSTLMPWAPTIVSVKRVNGNIQISMIRRTRIGFEMWDVSDVPLGEETEAYELDIKLPSGVRTLKSTQPFFVYPADMEWRDFGYRQTVLDFTAYQMSTLMGRGFPKDYWSLIS